jgi:hypothetical protein
MKKELTFGNIFNQMNTYINMFVLQVEINFYIHKILRQFQ